MTEEWPWPRHVRVGTDELDKQSNGAATQNFCINESRQKARWKLEIRAFAKAGCTRHKKENVMEDPYSAGDLL